MAYRMTIVKMKRLFGEMESEIVFTDKGFAIEMVKLYGMNLKYANEALKNDKDVVMCAVANDGRSLQHASQGLRCNKEVVLRAVKNKGRALWYASQGLRCDKEFVTRLVEINGVSIHYADASIRYDVELIVKAASNNHWYRQYETDKALIDKVLSSGRCVFREFIMDFFRGRSGVLLYDDNVVMHLVLRNGMLLDVVPLDLRLKRHIALAAVEQCGVAYVFVPETLKQDREIVMAAIKSYPRIFEHIPQAMRLDKDIVMSAIKSNKRVLQYMPSDVMYDTGFIFKMLLERLVTASDLKSCDTSIYHIVLDFVDSLINGEDMFGFVMRIKNMDEHAVSDLILSNLDIFLESDCCIKILTFFMRHYPAHLLNHSVALNHIYNNEDALLFLDRLDVRLLSISELNPDQAYDDGDVVNHMVHKHHDKSVLFI